MAAIESMYRETWEDIVISESLPYIRTRESGRIVKITEDLVLEVHF